MEKRGNENRCLQAAGIMLLFLSLCKSLIHITLMLGQDESILSVEANLFQPAKIRFGRRSQKNGMSPSGGKRIDDVMQFELYSLQLWELCSIRLNRMDQYDQEDRQVSPVTRWTLQKSNYNRASDMAMCECGNRLLKWLMSPKSQVMFASAFSWIGVFCVFLAFIVFTLRPLCWIYEYACNLKHESIGWDLQCV